MRTHPRRLSYSVAIALALHAGSLIADAGSSGLLSDSELTFERFGDVIPADVDPVQLGDAIAAIDGHQWQGTVTGTVTKVCQKEGCWMALVDGEHYARVTFKDYAFFVPTDIATRSAIVHGKLSLEKTAGSHHGHGKHHGNEASHMGKASSEAMQFQIVASAVAIASE
ncbi:MAG: DUF4920 domain-containing protein [Pseudomonadota bacterium]